MANERPILELSTKDFLTGIAPSAHTERGGLFLSADGITPVYDPGGSESAENGLLQAGPAPTNIGGATVVDTIRAAVSGVLVSTVQAFFYGDEGHIYRMVENGTISDIRDGAGGNPSAVSNSRAGIKIWGPTASSSRGLLYWQSSQIGLYDGTTWDDDYSATVPTGGAAFSTTYPVPHIFNGDVFWNLTSTGKIAALLDSGAGTVSYTASYFTYDNKKTCFSISDDGVYLVFALADNQEGADLFANNEIVFVDKPSALPVRRYFITDPFIWKLERLSNSILAFGQKGVYEVSFGGGVHKLPYYFTAFGTPTDVVLGYGTQRATRYNQDALIWATDSIIATLGSLDASLPSAHYRPFKVPSGVGTPTLVFTQFAAGSVYVATDGDKLYRYDFNGATRETNVSAKTIYFPLKQPVQIKRIDVVLGEPLASGDAFDIDTKVDEDTAAVDFDDSKTFANLGAKRYISLFPAKRPEAREQMSFTINLTGGAVKIKSFKVYGDPLTAKTA